MVLKETIKTLRKASFIFTQDVEANTVWSSKKYNTNKDVGYLVLVKIISLTLAFKQIPATLILFGQQRKIKCAPIFSLPPF